MSYRKNTNNQFTEWFLDKIEKEYPDDVDLVLGCSSLQAPGYEDETRPDIFVPATKRGYELASLFLIGRCKYDIYPRPWDEIEQYVALEHYDTMLFADSTLLYARNENIVLRYQDCLMRLEANKNNPNITMNTAIHDYNRAIEIFEECCFQTDLSTIMMCGGYVCDFLTHSLAAINGTYIPKSFTGQYEFILSCEKRPDGFEQLWYAVNNSHDAGEIKQLCSLLLRKMKIFLGQNGSQNTPLETDGLARWYEEMTEDFNRIRGFAKKRECMNVRGWATKLQWELNNAHNDFGLRKFSLLSNYKENNMDDFLHAVDDCEKCIADIIASGGTSLRRYANVADYIKSHTLTNTLNER